MSDVVDSKNCENYEVLLFGNHTCLVERLKQDLEYALKENSYRIIESLVSQQSNQSFSVIIDNSRYDKQWFEEGKECQLLKLGAKEWQPGTLKMKVTLEFCPDEPEEDEVDEEEEMDEMVKSLDDIRQTLNRENNS
ncbi:MAG: KGK domain-containing protein [Planktothrix sp. GU0601_MAG3]|nr:MAG: KGK domain-containing protein [Planktothrix sp. GU0601_MAG3]